MPITLTIRELKETSYLSVTATMITLYVITLNAITLNAVTLVAVTLSAVTPNAFAMVQALAYNQH